MDAAIAVLALGLALATVIGIGALLRRTPPPPSVAPADLLQLREAIAELRASHAQAVGELRGEVQRSLGATEQQVLTHAGSTQRAIGDLARQLAVVGEQSQRVAELARDIGSLSDLLRAPKPRGGFGELLMERLLADHLPVSAYQLQYTYRDGSRVDAVVHYGGRLVPIDAKFPIEPYKALASAADDAERRARRRAFVQQVKRHIDAVARYVSPADGTIDFSFMYVPSESVFYEAFVVDDESDLQEICAQKKVIPASPNTLVAYLQLVSLGLRGLAMQERTRELHTGLRHAALELEKFRALHDQLGRHLENAGKKYQESARGLDRATDALAALGRAPAAEQATLPISPGVERLFEDELAAEER
ncbi:MAG TPA: DNA recombination protein RmuC [Candidatus Limnocylindria bacterium]|nr:DNA recombination protein RmuC [Candidatus Limnocylindria bacterium]